MARPGIVALVFAACVVLTNAADISSEARVVNPVALEAVRLHGATWQARATHADLEYLLDMLPVDSLLYCFRKTAGLNPKTPDMVMGGWEACNVEICGQFLGHYLSALSRLWQSTGEQRIVTRLREVVTGLEEVQKVLGGGYLSAFPSEHFDRLQGLQQVWAPYYVIHKIMAGLLDVHQRVGPHKGAIPALSIVVQMASYFGKRVNETIKVNGTEHWQQMLNDEFGGMGEVMYHMYSVTGDVAHLDLANRFQKDVFLKPLFEKKDKLAGNHANTHLAQVNALAARYEVTGDREALEGVKFFFETVRRHHAFTTGGTSDHEFWGPPDALADAIWQKGDSLVTQETCTVYNMLKIARYLFTWTKDPAYLDYYERALLNGILGAARLRPDLASDFAPLGLTTTTTHSLEQRVSDNAVGQTASDASNERARKAGANAAAGAAAGEAASSQSRRSLAAVQSQHHESAMAYLQTAHESNTAANAGQSRDASLASRSDGLDTHRSTLPQPVSAEDDDSTDAYRASNSMQTVGMAAAIAAGLPAPGASRGGEMSTPPGTGPYGPGQFIYYQPLGAGTARNDSFFHWGQPTNSFWCCYGSSVESFSKLADSVYFVDDSSAVPTLHITQFASSSFNWQSAGLAVTLTVQLYGPARRVLLQLDIDVVDASKALPRGAEINARVPSWAVSVPSIAGCAPGVVCSAGAPGGWSRFAGAFVSGSTFKMEMEMGVRMEVIQDSRPENHVLRSLLMGPYVMAAFSHGHNNITLPCALTPTQLAQRLTPVPPHPTTPMPFDTAARAPAIPGTDLWADGSVVSLMQMPARAPPLSLALRGAEQAASHGGGRPRFLQHWAGTVLAGEALHNGHALDASFRVHRLPGDRNTVNTAAPMSCKGRCDTAAPRPVRVMLEALTQPGSFLGAGPLGGALELHTMPLGGPAEAAQRWSERHTFRVTPSGEPGDSGELGGGSCEHPVSLEIGSAPGTVLAFAGDAAVLDPSERRAAEADVTVSVSAQRRKLRAGSAAEEGLHGQGVAEARRTGGQQLCVMHAVGQLPAGAHKFKGDDRSYLVAPWGNLVDVHYAVYFTVAHNTSQVSS